jgi:AcrR family transcriptional regulator
MASRRGDGPRLTRGEKQRQTRACLLRSAATVLGRRGLHGASIDEIAADAGFTKGAFYANFESKQDLFLAMLDERFAERLAQLEALTGAEDRLEDQARSAGGEFARYVSADPAWERLFLEFAAHAARDDAFRAELVERYRALRAGMAAIFERRLSELGVHSPVPVDRLVLMTFSLANGFALERLLEPDAAPEELFGDTLVLLLEGVRAMAAQNEVLGSPSG